MSRLRRLRPYATTLALCLAAAVTGIVVLVDRAAVSTDEGAARKRNLFPAWREDDIRRVELRLGDETLALVAEPAGDDGARSWVLSRGGEHVDADAQAVGSLLGTLEFAGFERAATGAAADAALAEVLVAVTLDMGGLELGLVIGAAAPAPEGARYAAVDVTGRERSRYVVSKQLVTALLDAVPTLRAHELTPYLSLDLESLSESGPGGAWRLVRGGWAGRDAVAFALERDGQKLRAAREGVSGLLGALGRLEAERFPPGPVPSSNPGARFTLTLTPRDATRPAARLEVGGACPDGGAGVYLVRTGARPVAACVSDAAARALELTEDALVDRHLVGAEAHDVLELKLTDVSRKLELARREEGWHMRAPIDTQLSGEVVEGRLDRILALEGELLPATSDRAALGLAPPAGTARVISLGRAGGEERTELINLGVEREGKVALERVEDGTLLSVDATAARALQPDSATLRALEIYTVELKWFRGLRLRARSQRQELRRDVNGAWTMLEPKLEGLRADPGLASELAERFGSLRAIGWNAEKADAAMGLDAPWCELEADVAEEGKPDGPWRKLRVSLGAPTEGGYFARHDDDPAVFVAPKGLGEAAQGWLLDRGGLLVDLARVTAVTVTKGALVLAFERKGAHLAVRSGPNKTEAAAAVVEDALRQLMAEGVVRLGPKDKAEGFDAPLLAIELELAPPGAADPPQKLRLEVGAGEIWRETSVFYVRKAGLDATFAVAQSRLRPLSELF